MLENVIGHYTTAHIRLPMSVDVNWVVMRRHNWRNDFASNLEFR